MKYCRECGVSAPDNAKFCENCGTAFLLKSAAPESPETDPGLQEPAPGSMTEKQDDEALTEEQQKQIKNLEDLKEKGFITESQFRSRRRDVVGFDALSVRAPSPGPGKHPSSLEKKEPDADKNGGGGSWIQYWWIIALVVIVLVVTKGCGLLSARESEPVRPSEHFLSDAEAFTLSTQIVKERLKSPSTARFCSLSEATVKYLGNGGYTVAGWVDAQNGFGATIRTKYVVTFTETIDQGQVGAKNIDVAFGE